jgi:hypothetical protein
MDVKPYPLSFLGNDRTHGKVIGFSNEFVIFSVEKIIRNQLFVNLQRGIHSGKFPTALLLQ